MVEAQHVVCRHCLATNRVPAARLVDDPVCGRCSKALLDGETATLTDATFDLYTGKMELPVIVDFWATWCGPCVSMAPHFMRAAAELKGRVVFAKVDTDANPLVSQRFGVRSIPTIVRLVNGRETARMSGAISANAIVSFAR
jgi:thioredoxin 2